MSVALQREACLSSLYQRSLRKNFLATMTIDAPFQILIVDDEPNIRSGLIKGLSKEVQSIDFAGTAEEAIAKFRSSLFQLAIVDVRLPGTMSGLDLLSAFLEYRPDTTVIVITAHGTVETAVEAMRRGAFDFITKPVELNLLRQQVQKALEHHRLREENRLLKDRLADSGQITGMIGSCTAMQNVFEQIRNIASTEATVFVTGESGTGKELVAHGIHDMSSRRHAPFVAVNLGAMPETLLESELFGHEKGSFTGATRQRPGCFERAENGTLFLDEVTEMSAKSQIDLLRVLETGQYSRVGGDQILFSNARIVAATNKNVLELIDKEQFRVDLYYRLNIIPIHIPALRERREDIPLLVEHFLEHFCQRHQRGLKQFDQQALQTLVQAQWPGNVRQLRNMIERLVVTHSQTTITNADLPAELIYPQMSGQKLVRSLLEVTEQAEREAIKAALMASDYHRESTAKLLGVSVRTLHYKMSRYNLH